jgi:glycerol-3-phosphate dehydrogenase
MAGVDVQLRPAKGIHLVYPHRISNFSISAESVDGRDLLLVAHAGFTLLGTTDDDFYGDLDSVDVLEDEVEYLIQGIERVFASIDSQAGWRTTTGVRPTLFKWRRYEDGCRAATRSSIIRERSGRIHLDRGRQALHVSPDGQETSTPCAASSDTRRPAPRRRDAAWQRSGA